MVFEPGKKYEIKKSTGIDFALTIKDVQGWSTSQIEGYLEAVEILTEHGTIEKINKKPGKNPIFGRTCV